MNKRERTVAFVELVEHAPDVIMWGGKAYCRRFSDSDNYLEASVLVLDDASAIVKKAD